MCEESGQSEGRTNPPRIRPFSAQIPIAVLTADPLWQLLQHPVKVDQLAFLLKTLIFTHESVNMVLWKGKANIL